MKVHSEVGLVTNSSSETYTWPNSDIQDRLREIGERMIEALGLDKTFDEVFEIRRTLSGEFIDRVSYSEREYEGVPDGFADRWSEAREAAKNALIPEGWTEPWYKLENSDEIRQAMNDAGNAVIEAEIDVDKIPDGGGYDDDSYGYSSGNIDYALVSKVNGAVFDFDSIFNMMYSQEASYNG